MNRYSIEFYSASDLMDKATKLLKASEAHYTQTKQALYDNKIPFVPIDDIHIVEVWLHKVPHDKKQILYTILDRNMNIALKELGVTIYDIQE